MTHEPSPEMLALALALDGQWAASLRMDGLAPPPRRLVPPPPGAPGAEPSAACAKRAMPAPGGGGNRCHAARHGASTVGAIPQGARALSAIAHRTSGVAPNPSVRSNRDASSA